jgi:hypothetical protein
MDIKMIPRDRATRPPRPVSQPRPYSGDTIPSSPPEPVAQSMLPPGAPPPPAPLEPRAIIIRGRTYTPGTPQYQAYQLYQAGYKPQDIRRTVGLPGHGWRQLMEAFRRGDVIVGFQQL